MKIPCSMKDMEMEKRVEAYAFKKAAMRAGAMVVMKRVRANNIDHHYIYDLEKGDFIGIESDKFNEWVESYYGQGGQTCEIYRISKSCCIYEISKK